MPVQWNVDPASRRAVLTFVDPYTIDEWREALLGILRTPGLPPDFAILVDRRNATPPQTTFVHAMISFFQAHARELTAARAAVVVNDDVSYGMSRMVTMRAETCAPGLEIDVFRNYDEALRWLDGPAAP